MVAKTATRSAKRFLRLLPALVLAASLPALVSWPAQAQDDQGIRTTQTADPNPATVGQPLTFTVTVTNGSVPQHVGLKDFLPQGMELVSATPSRGNCEPGHHGHNAVVCTLGELPNGGSATVEIVVLPTVPGSATNMAVGGGRHSPQSSDEATIAVNPVAE